ncbi:hypothetical protein GCM10010433_70040 [Streptomyces pulveraceus]
MERAYPAGVGTPSDICTPMVAGIRHGAMPAARPVATGPAEARLPIGSVLLAVAIAAMTRAVAEASAIGRRWSRIRWRGFCIQAPRGPRQSAGPDCALRISLLRVVRGRSLSAPFGWFPATKT